MCPALSPSFTSAPHLTFFSAPPPELSLSPCLQSQSPSLFSLFLSHISPSLPAFYPFLALSPPDEFLSQPPSSDSSRALPCPSRPDLVAFLTAPSHSYAHSPLDPAKSLPTPHTKKRVWQTHSTSCQLFTAASFPVILSTFAQLPASRELLSKCIIALAAFVW